MFIVYLLFQLLVVFPVHRARLVPQDIKDLWVKQGCMVPRGHQAHGELMVPLALLVHQADLALRACATVILMNLLARLDPPVHPVSLVTWEIMALPVAPLACMETAVPWVHPDLLVWDVPPVVQGWGRLGQQVPLDLQARQAQMDSPAKLEVPTG